MQIRSLIFITLWGICASPEINCIDGRNGPTTQMSTRAVSSTVQRSRPSGNTAHQCNATIGKGRSSMTKGLCRMDGQPNVPRCSRLLFGSIRLRKRVHVTANWRPIALFQALGILYPAQENAAISHLQQKEHSRIYGVGECIISN